MSNLLIANTRVLQRRFGIIVNCTFNAADGTLLQNYPWTDPADVRPSTNQWLNTLDRIGIQSNKATQVAIGSCFASINTPNSDCSGSILYNTGLAVGDRFIAVRMRGDNTAGSSNRWLAILRSDNTFKLNRSTTTVAQVPLVWQDDTDYVISWSLSGQDISVTIDGGGSLETLNFVSNVYQFQTNWGFHFFSTAATRWTTAENFLLTVP